jgi:hypothetical protein
MKESRVGVLKIKESESELLCTDCTALIDGSSMHQSVTDRDVHV